jgi:enamine deaminase RidA (YjgF/YER057c/UK114 family)
VRDECGTSSGGGWGAEADEPRPSTYTNRRARDGSPRPTCASTARRWPRTPVTLRNVLESALGACKTPQAERASFCGPPGPGVYGAVIERRAIQPDAWAADLEWYRETRLSPAVQIGDLLSVAGCTGATAAEDGPRAQMRRAYEEIGQVLDAAGASWDDVVSMTTYHVHFRRDIDAMTEIHREFVTKEPFPAWTAVGVTALYEPAAIVEISIHALVPRSYLGD